MATVRRQVYIASPPEDVWDAIRDIGALHTRLVPGFVVDTTVEKPAGGRGLARLVTFANGAEVREPIVAIDESAYRLVWSAEGGITTHYNASAQALREGDGTRVVWIADFLPDTAEPLITGMMDAGIAAMGAAFTSPHA